MGGLREVYFDTAWIICVAYYAIYRIDSKGLLSIGLFNFCHVLRLYAYNTDAEHHSRARQWLESSLSGAQLFGLSWQTITAFIRIGTNPRAFPNPLQVSEAAEIVSSWIARPSVIILVPGERHWEILSGLLTEGQAYGPLVMDAHLAALAIEHGATLYTTDKDFSRFSGLQVINPLDLQQ